MELDNSKSITLLENAIAELSSFNESRRNGGREMSEKLKSCPFCGREAEVLSTGFMYCVMCISCLDNVDWCKTEQEAIEAWNRRPENAKS